MEANVGERQIKCPVIATGIQRPPREAKAGGGTSFNGRAARRGLSLLQKKRGLGRGRDQLPWPVGAIGFKCPPIAAGKGGALY